MPLCQINGSLGTFQQSVTGFFVNGPQEFRDSTTSFVTDGPQTFQGSVSKFVQEGPKTFQESLQNPGGVKYNPDPNAPSE